MPSSRRCDGHRDGRRHAVVTVITLARHSSESWNPVEQRCGLRHVSFTGFRVKHGMAAGWCALRLAMTSLLFSSEGSFGNHYSGKEKFSYNIKKAAARFIPAVLTRRIIFCNVLTESIPTLLV